MTVELPAGLVDAGESAEEAALRELQEETGYVGSISSCSQSIGTSPGLTDEAFKLVVVDVDLDAPANRQPQQVVVGVAVATRTCSTARIPFIYVFQLSCLSQRFSLCQR